MKIHTDPDHTAYHHAISVCRVFLEGAERNNVLFADEEGRFAVTLRLDEFGRPMRKGEKLLTDDFCGHVRIECPDWVRQQCEKGPIAYDYVIG
jgi:hypothetical protein